MSPLSRSIVFPSTSQCRHYLLQKFQPFLLSLSGPFQVLQRLFTAFRVRLPRYSSRSLSTYHNLQSLPCSWRKYIITQGLTYCYEPIKLVEIFANTGLESVNLVDWNKHSRKISAYCNSGPTKYLELILRSI